MQISAILQKDERLPMFCHHCILLGHDLKHYASHYAASKNGGEVPYQYGDQLRAIGLRSWSPPKRDHARFTPTGSEGQTETSCDGRAGDQQLTAGTTVIVNPSGYVMHENRNNENKGAALNFQELKDINAGMRDTVTGNQDVNVGVTNLKEVNVLSGLNAD